MSHSNNAYAVLTSQLMGVKRFLKLDNKVLQPHLPPLRREVGEAKIRAWREEFVQSLLAERLGRC